MLGFRPLASAPLAAGAVPVAVVSALPRSSRVLRRRWNDEREKEFERLIEAATQAEQAIAEAAPVLPERVVAKAERIAPKLVEGRALALASLAGAGPDLSSIAAQARARIEARARAMIALAREAERIAREAEDDDEETFLLLAA